MSMTTEVITPEDGPMKKVTVELDPTLCIEQGQDFCDSLEEIAGPFMCVICDCTGTMPDDEERYPSFDSYKKYAGNRCPVCNGTGKAPMEAQERFGYTVLQFHNFYP